MRRGGRRELGWFKIRERRKERKKRWKNITSFREIKRKSFVRSAF